MATKTGGTKAAKKSTRKQVKKKFCSACEKEKTLNDFYASYNPMHSDGRTPMCKECITNECYDADNNEIDLDKLKSMLRQLDKPFITRMWDAAVKQVGDSTVSKKSVVGIYFKNINTLQQVRSLNWEQGLEYENKDVQTQLAVGGSRRKSTTINDRVYYLPQEDFNVTEEVIRQFGEGYTAKEYELMSNYYETLKHDYPSLTSSQKNLLLRYVRFAAKEEIATALGQTQEASKWADLSNSAMKQLNSIDTQNGVTSFSEFFLNFERAQDISRILPQFKYRPNDAPDFIIWCYINYCRRLEGKPEVEYADVYKFYDDKVNEYIKQYGDPYGIFKDSPILENREKIKEFIVLPPEYFGDE